MSDPFIYQDEIDALSYLKLPDGAVIFDVGCSYGEYTMEVIKKMGNHPFTVHCFDPVEDFCNVQKNKFKNFTNIIQNCLAMSDEKGETMFYRIKCSTNQAVEGCSSLYNRPVFKTNHMPVVPIMISTDTLDNYIKDTGIIHIDLMKIDTEGSELRVLKGGSDMFKRNLVDIIQFEYNDSYKDSGATMKDIIDFIYDYNYMLADFKGGKYVELHSFVEDYGFHNYYLINRDYFNTL